MQFVEQVLTFSVAGKSYIRLAELLYHAPTAKTSSINFTIAVVMSNDLRDKVAE